MFAFDELPGGRLILLIQLQVLEYKLYTRIAKFEWEIQRQFQLTLRTTIVGSFKFVAKLKSS